MKDNVYMSCIQSSILTLSMQPCLDTKVMHELIPLILNRFGIMAYLEKFHALLESGQWYVLI